MLPATRFVIAFVGIALLVFAMPNTIPWFRRSRSGFPRRHEPLRRTADDALDSARMDDDGGGQTTRPPA